MGGELSQAVTDGILAVIKLYDLNVEMLKAYDNDDLSEDHIEGIRKVILHIGA